MHKTAYRDMGTGQAQSVKFELSYLPRFKAIVYEYTASSTLQRTYIDNSINRALQDARTLKAKTGHVIHSSQNNNLGFNLRLRVDGNTLDVRLNPIKDQDTVKRIVQRVNRDHAPTYSHQDPWGNESLGPQEDALNARRSKG